MGVNALYLEGVGLYWGLGGARAWSGVCQIWADTLVIAGSQRGSTRGGNFSRSQTAYVTLFFERLSSSSSMQCTWNCLP